MDLATLHVANRQLSLHRKFSGTPSCLPSLQESRQPCRSPAEENRCPAGSCTFESDSLCAVLPGKGFVVKWFVELVYHWIIWCGGNNMCKECLCGGYNTIKVNSCAIKWVAVETRQQQVESEWSPSCKCCVAMRQYLVAVHLCNHGDGNGGGKSCGVFMHCCWFNRPHGSDYGNKF